MPVERKIIIRRIKKEQTPEQRLIDQQAKEIERLRKRLGVIESYLIKHQLKDAIPSQSNQCCSCNSYWGWTPYLPPSSPPFIPWNEDNDK